MIKKQFRRVAAAGAVASLLATSGRRRLGVRGQHRGSCTSATPGAPSGRATGRRPTRPVHPGGLTATDVQVRNDGSNTLNHASLLRRHGRRQRTREPALPEAGWRSRFPTGLDLRRGVPAGRRSTCVDRAGRERGQPGHEACRATWVRSPASRRRPCGSSSRRARATTTAATWFGVYLNEGNQTGSNQDNFYSTGTITTGSTDCSGSADANYFLPTTTVSLSTDPSCSTAVAAGHLRGQAHREGRLREPVGQDHQPDLVPGDRLHVRRSRGARPRSWAAAMSRAASSGPSPGTARGRPRGSSTSSIPTTPTMPAHASDYKVILFTKAYQCSAKLTTNCWVTTSASKPNAEPAVVQGHGHHAEQRDQAHPRLGRLAQSNHRRNAVPQSAAPRLSMPSVRAAMRSRTSGARAPRSPPRFPSA